MPKAERLQIKINEWEEWRDVVGVRPRNPSPALSGGKQIYLEKLLILEGGVQVDPRNPNIQRRRK